MTKDADFKKQVRARMAATGEAYMTARMQLLTHRADHAPPTTPSLVHVTNGDSVVHSLRDSGLEGAVLAWRDVLHEGPVPGTAPPDELRTVRAGYIANRWKLPYEELLRDLVDRDRMLEGARLGAYVLWFEADLYDQLQLIQVLSMLHELRVDPERIHLISIGEYPGIAHFGGLGELTPVQLADLYERRERLDSDTLGIAVSGWNTFRSPDPTSLTDTGRWTSHRLRFLAESFARLAQEYPWRSDGLSLTERRILASVAHEPLGLPEIFARLWRKESRPYLGDWSCFSTIRDLALAASPLLCYVGRGPDDAPDLGRVALTETGRQVLAGALDHIALNGPDRWIGGVHLRPGNPQWRYDDRLEILTIDSHGDAGRCGVG